MGNSEIGARLKQARTEAGLTQAQVCEKLDIPKVQTLSAYERGENNPPVEALKNLARLYKVTTDSILFGDEAVDLNEKSPKEYVKQLVDAADHLGLSFEETYLGGATFTMLRLSSVEYVDFNTFVGQWTRLRKLLDTNTIEQEEYEALMHRRYDSLTMEECSSPIRWGGEYYGEY